MTNKLELLTAPHDDTDFMSVDNFEPLPGDPDFNEHHHTYDLEDNIGGLVVAKTVKNSDALAA